MAKKHVNADKMATSQKAQQSAARKAEQQKRGSAKFKNGSNPHTDGGGQSGQQKTR